MKFLTALLSFAWRLWDYFMSPAKRKARRQAKADKAIDKRDVETLNKLLDLWTRR